MPTREEPLITGEIYHIYNRTIDKHRIFVNNISCFRFVEAMRYYRSSQFNYSLSTFYRTGDEFRKTVEEKICDKKYHRAQIITYTLMPTHFHLLVKQMQTNGICTYISNIKNAFTRYYNIKHKRNGPLFESRFKAVCMRTDEQLMHTSRYIHLNPYSSDLVSEHELQEYQWSSFGDYVTGRSSFITAEPVLDLFRGDRLKYKHFVLQNAGYQKQLEEVKHRRG